MKYQRRILSHYGLDACEPHDVINVVSPVEVHAQFHYAEPHCVYAWIPTRRQPVVSIVTPYLYPEFILTVEIPKVPLPDQ